MGCVDFHCLCAGTHATMNPARLTGTYKRKGRISMRPDVADFYGGISFDAYRLLGARPTGQGWQFTVWAPHARRVQVLGDWNGWNLWDAVELAACEDGLWRGKALHAREGQLYKYNILGPDGTWRLKADPFAFGYESLPGTAGRLLRPVCHFTDDDWMAGRRWLPDVPLNIYELHATSWRRHWDGRYYSGRELADVLIPYLLARNFTCVELMPLAEYPFDGSWGYHGCGYFAPTARLGGLAGLTELIDRLHQAQIAVLADFVPVHFAPDPERLACWDGGPLFEAGPSDWGSLRFDLSSGPVRSFLLSAAAFWIYVLHCDGLRVDAVGHALYRSQAAGEALAAAEFFKTLTGGLHARFGPVFLAAEDTAGALNAAVPTDRGGLGFDAVWDSAWTRDVLDFFADPPDRAGRFPALLRDPGPGTFVNALSHDDNTWDSGSVWWRLPGSGEEKFRQMQVLYLLQFTRPGRPLTFMGGEFGQPLAFDPYKEMDWACLGHPLHSAMDSYTAELGALFAARPALHRGHFRWVLRDRDRLALGYLREWGGERLLCLFNLGLYPLSVGPETSGACRADLLFAAGPVDNDAVRGSEGSLSLHLPPMSGAVFALS